MPADDEWVEVYTREVAAGDGDGLRALTVGLAVHGLEPFEAADVRIDRICGRGGELRSWQRVLVRRSAYEARRSQAAVSTPLASLTRPDDGVELSRERDLSSDEVKQLLRQPDLPTFVIAEAGLPLAWVRSEVTYDVWKLEVKGHLAEPGTPIHLEAFPDEYAYSASLWAQPEVEGRPAILLVKHH